MARWTQCYKQETIYGFTEAFNLLIEDYCDQEDLINYLRDEWWPYRMEFATCFTNLYMHFGNQ